MRFSAPYNWCDGDCERCPLIDECALAKREAGRRWSHRARGRDPDGPEVQADDAIGAMQSALKMLEHAAREHGIDLSAPAPPPPPTPLQLTRIRRAGMDHTLALHELAACLADREPQRASLEKTIARAAALIGPKVARLCGTDPEVWECDGVPNLLLVEHIDRETSDAIERDVERLDAMLLARYLETRDRLRELLADWSRAVSTRDRDELDGMIEAGTAPSPFAERDH